MHEYYSDVVVGGAKNFMNNAKNLCELVFGISESELTVNQLSELGCISSREEVALRYSSSRHKLHGELLTYLEVLRLGVTYHFV